MAISEIFYSLKRTCIGGTVEAVAVLLTTCAKMTADFDPLEGEPITNEVGAELSWPAEGFDRLPQWSQPLKRCESVIIIAFSY